MGICELTHVEEGRWRFPHSECAGFQKDVVGWLYMSWRKHVMATQVGK